MGLRVVIKTGPLIEIERDYHHHHQTCKDLMKDLIKKEYSTYFGSDGRSETSSYGAEKFMLERKISPFSIRSFW